MDPNGYEAPSPMSTHSEVTGAELELVCGPLSPHTPQAPGTVPYALFMYLTQIQASQYTVRRWSKVLRCLCCWPCWVGYVVAGCCRNAAALACRAGSNKLFDNVLADTENAFQTM
jgi:hypothetical protein